jgi:uncharacterized membrane protein YeaQ/YmgE (transglycosylase-associated protein family)
MGITLFILLGFSVGLIARALYPGRESMGIVMTVVLGVIGSLVGGLLANLLAGRSLFDVNTAGFMGSVICAVALLASVGANGRYRRLV